MLKIEFDLLALNQQQKLALADYLTRSAGQVVHEPTVVPAPVVKAVEDNHSAPTAEEVFAPAPLAQTAAPGAVPPPPAVVAETAPVAPTTSVPVPPPPATATQPSAETSAPGSVPTPPPAVAPQASTPPSGVVVDSRGLPHDPRIHASTKSQNADGSWKYARGIDRETLVPQVEAELRRLMAIPAPTVAVVPPPPVVSSAEVPPPPAVAAPVAVIPPPPATTAPIAEAAPPVATPPATPTADVAAAVTVGDVFKRVTALQSEGKLPPEKLAEVLAMLGFASMIEIGKRPDMAGALLMAIEQAAA